MVENVAESYFTKLSSCETQWRTRRQKSAHGSGFGGTDRERASSNRELSVTFPALTWDTPFGEHEFWRYFAQNTTSGETFGVVKQDIVPIRA